MEQSLLAPSQFRLTSMSIDSRFADQYYHGTSDFMIRLPSTMRNVMRVALSSVELPENVYVFSAKAGNTCFDVSYNGTSYPLDISAGNYTGEELAAALDAKLTGVNPNFHCSYNSITDRFTFTTTGDPYTVTLTCSTPPTGPCDGPCPDGGITSRKRFWGLGYNMGFRITYDKVDSRNQIIYDATQYPFTVTSAVPLTACQSPQITVPPYALLQLRCPDMMENTLHRTADGSFVQALAKLVLRSGAYQIQYDDGGNFLRKENTFQSPTSMTQFRISIVDAYGQLLEMGDTDWSMTFEIMEVVNSCQYNELNRAYGRC